LQGKEINEQILTEKMRGEHKETQGKQCPSAYTKKMSLMSGSAKPQAGTSTTIIISFVLAFQCSEEVQADMMLLSPDITQLGVKPGGSLLGHFSHTHVINARARLRMRH
jgi:hypothetical protein